MENPNTSDIHKIPLQWLGPICSRAFHHLNLCPSATRWKTQPPYSEKIHKHPPAPSSLVSNSAPLANSLGRTSSGALRPARDPSLSFGNAGWLTRCKGTTGFQQSIASLIYLCSLPEHRQLRSFKSKSQRNSSSHKQPFISIADQPVISRTAVEPTQRPVGSSFMPDTCFS